MQKLSERKISLETRGDGIFIMQGDLDNPAAQVMVSPNQVDSLVTWLHKARDVLEQGRGGSVRYST